MKKGNKKKTPSSGAKLAPISSDAVIAPISIEINGFVYTCYGNSRVESIVESVEAHIENDREFSDDINVMQQGHINDVVYAPAVLCMLGYFEKGDLYNLLVGQTMEGLQDDSREPKQD